MPELPEVEVVRADLDRVLVGRTISRVEVGGDRAVRREPDEATFVAALNGRAVTDTRRVGKFIVVGLEGDDAVVVHLGMSGQLRLAPNAPSERPRHTHVVWTLDDGHEVQFVDPRTFGQMFRSPVDRMTGRPRALAHLGPDALCELDDPVRLADAMASRRVAVKVRLMDQRAIAGLGNIYSDEILFRAGVLGRHPAGSLGPDEIGRLHRACAVVLRDAIAARGSSLADAQYVDLFGLPGAYQRAHAVHARVGQPCPRCGTEVRRERIGGRFGYWCPRCQV